MTQTSSAKSSANRIITGDARQVLPRLARDSIDLSVWSPPYGVGKSYESGETRETWRALIEEVMQAHATLVRPGAFVVVNLADILCEPDPLIGPFEHDDVTRKRVSVTESDIESFRRMDPRARTADIAQHFGCSVQTIVRRLGGNTARMGRRSIPTKVLLTGSELARWAQSAGLYLYDRRVWHKGPAWKSSPWHANTYRSIDESEFIYVFRRPGRTIYDRSRLEPEEWRNWGSRGVWTITSVANRNLHEAAFPEELARRIITLLSAKGETILDPFAGSGTTTAVAKRLGREWIGVELDPGYAQAARERTAAATPSCRKTSRPISSA